MKRNIILLLTILLVLTIIVAVQAQRYYTENQKIQQQAQTYEAYKDTIIFGTDVATIINKIADENAHNTNQIEVKLQFLESDQIYSMEPIIKQGIENFVQYYGARPFQCTNIDYEGKRITTLWIEEVDIQ